MHFVVYINPLLDPLYLQDYGFIYAKDRINLWRQNKSVFSLSKDNRPIHATWNNYVHNETSKISRDEGSTPAKRANVSTVPKPTMSMIMKKI